MRKFKSLLSLFLLVKGSSLMADGNIIQEKSFYKTRNITLSEKDLIILIRSMAKDAIIRNISDGSDPYSVEDTINLITEEDLHKNIRIISVLERDLKLGSQDGFAH